MPYDMHNDIEPKVAINTTAISSDTTTTGNEIDLDGYESAEFIFQSGAITDGDYTPLITESDTSGGSFTAVADTDLIGTEAEAAFTDDDDDNKVSRIGYRGSKQFIKAALVSTGTSSGGTFGATVILGNPLIKKTAANSQ